MMASHASLKKICKILEKSKRYNQLESIIKNISRKKNNNIGVIPINDNNIDIHANDEELTKTELLHEYQYHKSIDIKNGPVFVLASGPSLNAHDIELVRASNIPTIVVNRTWECVPFSTIIFAGDELWWRKYHNSINIPAELWTCSPPAAHRYRLKLLTRKGPFNSGLRAIQLAIHLGATRIYLLGYDCRYDGEKRHWHDDYPPGMGNAHSVKKWAGQFDKLASEYRGRVDIVNCSRSTALICFEKIALEVILGREKNN
jgi:hypothetical protein